MVFIHFTVSLLSNWGQNTVWHTSYDSHRDMYGNLPDLKSTTTPYKMLGRVSGSSMFYGKLMKTSTILWKNSSYMAKIVSLTNGSVF